MSSSADFIDWFRTFSTCYLHKHFEMSIEPLIIIYIHFAICVSYHGTWEGVNEPENFRKTNFVVTPLNKHPNEELT